MVVKRGILFIYKYRLLLLLLFLLLLLLLLLCNRKGGHESNPNPNIWNGF